MERRQPPDTATGHYVLHDFRSIDWDRWRQAPAADREDALAEARTFLQEAADADADGDLAIFSVVGHEADLFVLVLRPELGAIDTFRRQFEHLALADYTTREDSSIGVTEASGYTEAARAYFDDDAAVDPGLERYIESRLYPEIPDTAVVSYYPMSKRRTAEQNWYDLPYEERAEHVRDHGEIGKRHAGAVTQIITGSIGFSEWEWGVTLFAEEMPAIKQLLTEMRYDPSTSKYAEFGPFVVGRRFPVADLEAFLAGDPIPTDASSSDAPDLTADLATLPVEPEFPDEAWVVLARSEADEETVATAVDELSTNFDHYDSHEGTVTAAEDGEVAIVSGWATEQAAETAAGFLADVDGVDGYRIGQLGASATASSGEDAASTTDEADAVREALADRDVYAGTPHGEDIHALVRYSETDTETLRETVEELRGAFEADADHRSTRLYRSRSTDRAAVVSLWATSDAAEGAADRLAELPGMTAAGDAEDGFGTMGMFYTVKPGHRDHFVSTFDQVTDLLADMAGHRETQLLVNVENDRDMFIASEWRAKDDAMAFFRSDTFRETVQWGRDVLADRPRHVFLA